MDSHSTSRMDRRCALLQLAGLSVTPALITALTGCGVVGSGPSRPSPTAPAGTRPMQIQGVITAAADLNPDARKRPSPLLLRIYELRSDTAFRAADFVSLYQSDQALLGSDLVLKDELAVSPGETRPYERMLGAETRWLAVFGMYREFERADWRAIAPVPAGRPLRLNLRADSLALRLTLTP